MATDRIEAPPGRRSTPGEREGFWQRILQEQRASGLTHSEFCRRRSIPLHSYFWFKRTLGGKEGAAKGERRTSKAASEARALVPVRIRPQAAVLSSPWAYEVELRKERVIRLGAGFDEESLGRLVRLLEERC